VSQSTIDILVGLAVLTGWYALFAVLKSGLIGRSARWLRVRVSRRLPAGLHRAEGELRFSFGPRDEDMIIGVPVRVSPDGPPTRFTATTDSETRYSVGEREVTPDGWLEAYDDEAGPIEVEAHELGRVARMAIRKEPRRTPPEQETA